MSSPRRKLSILRNDPRQKIHTKRVGQELDRYMFTHWATGYTYQQLADSCGKTIPDVRQAIKTEIQHLAKAREKWLAAERRCRALGMALRLVHLPADQDQPLESLKCPPRWLKHFQAAGVTTVNRLRSIDTEMLISRYRFPAPAIDWAIVKLDRLELSHVLRAYRQS